MKTRLQEAEPRVVTCLHDLSVWYLQRTNRFPKNWRVTLGDRIDTLLIDALTTAQRARLRTEKIDLLIHLNEQLDVLRTLTRLSVALECLQGRHYEYVARQIDEVGRQIGGWIRHQRRKETEQKA